MTASSLDTRGRRVLVRESGAENWIWPGDGIQEVDIKLSRRDYDNMSAILDEIVNQIS